MQKDFGVAGSLFGSAQVAAPSSLSECKNYYYGKEESKEEGRKEFEKELEKVSEAQQEEGVQEEKVGFGGPGSP